MVVGKPVHNFANMAKNLNSGLPRTNPASHKGSWTWTRVLQITGPVLLLLTQTPSFPMHVNKLTNISTMWRSSHLVSPNFKLRSLIELCICNSNSTEDKVFAEYLQKKIQNNKNSFIQSLPDWKNNNNKNFPLNIFSFLN